MTQLVLYRFDTAIPPSGDHRGARRRPAALAAEHDRFAACAPVAALFSGGPPRSRQPDRTCLGGTAELTLEILDYPGEWLLDLPLLRRAMAIGRARPSPWRGAGCAPRSPATGSTIWPAIRQTAPPIRNGAAGARALPRLSSSACREREQLSLLQPGRFLNPGQIAGPFDPVVLPDAVRRSADGPRPGSLAALMEARFEAYKRTIVQPFFANSRAMSIARSCSSTCCAR